MDSRTYFTGVSYLVDFTPMNSFSPTAPNQLHGLGRLAAACFDHRRRVLATWIVLLVAIVAVSQVVGGHLSDSFSSGNSPSGQAQALLARRLRDQVIPPVVAGHGVTVLVGGETAASVDSATHLSARLPLVIGLVILLSFVLLAAVFRSIVIPVKAALMNLLSIGAAYGVIVAVFQWGWAISLFGASGKGPIDPWIPLMMFVITFGLSMDYEMFLLSSMQEEWVKTHDNATAVAGGLAKTAKVITAAAAIMVCVFGSFVINDPLRILDVFGLGLAVAILVDATVIRMILVPAVMELLGNRAWWMPEWLTRRLPTLTIESGQASA
jgi:RND superfamily putative drug exporter